MSQDPPQPPEDLSFVQRHKDDSPRKKWIVIVLALIMFTHTMDFMVLMPLGPKLMTLFQITPQQFSWLVSIYSFTAGICGFIGALLFDRLDRRWALLGCYLGFLIGTLSCGIATTYSHLLISRAIAGAFGGLLLGICFSILGDLFSIHERGAATGKLMTSFSLSAIIQFSASASSPSSPPGKSFRRSVATFAPITQVFSRDSLKTFRTQTHDAPCSLLLRWCSLNT